MDPQCEIIGKYALPIYRSMLAKELVQKYKLTQTEAAKKLGTTQAAISQYLSSKRAFKGMEHVEHYLPKIEAMAFDTARKIIKDEITTKTITIDFCKLCATFCHKDIAATKDHVPEYYI